ncbi:RHS repeat-associated core domain-containing protein [uncultured Microscilla sp.]|uniref:RHS repeat-associated core domain-containing protein n=1 Tax=uncultured Microscilla sp. TaxID=432653 RepID=UPI002613D548|nr:RHS repeat-associated core domain-containing protein [uncultured Microscilla sp.]
MNKHQTLKKNQPTKCPGQLKRRWFTLKAGLLLVSLLAISHFAQAQVTYNTWLGGNNNNDWNTATNWDQGRVPLATDHVKINAGTVNLNGSHTTAGFWVTDVATVNIGAANTLTVNGSSTITNGQLNGGKLISNGSNTHDFSTTNATLFTEVETVARKVNLTNSQFYEKVRFTKMLNTSYSNGNTYHQEATFIGKGGLAWYVSYATADTFKDNIVVGGDNVTYVTIGSQSFTTILLDGKKILIDQNNSTFAGLSFIKLHQKGGTPQHFDLQGSLVLNTCIWEASTVTSANARAITVHSVYHGEAMFEAGYYPQSQSYGNTYHQEASFTVSNSSNYGWYVSRTNPDIFHGDVTVGGHAKSLMYFGGDQTTIIPDGKTLKLAPNNYYPAVLDIKNVHQQGNAPQELHAGQNVHLTNNQWEGELSVKAVRIIGKNSTYHNNVSFSAGFYPGGSINGDIYHKQVTINHSGAHDWYMANDTLNTYHGALLLRVQGHGKLHMAHGAGTHRFQHDLILERSTTVGKIVFGAGGGQTILEGDNLQTIKAVAGKTGEADFHHLKIDKASNHVDLQTNINIVGTLEFAQGLVKATPESSGVLTFDTNGNYQNESAISHASGQVRKKGTGDFTFPLGDGTQLQPLTLSNLSTNAWITTYYKGSNQPTGQAVGGVCYKMNDCEHWVVRATSPVSFQAAVGTANACDLPAKPVLIWYNNTEWQTLNTTHDTANETLTANQTTNALANVTHYLTYGEAVEAGPISTTGNGSVACQNTSHTYTVPLVADATYQWTVPAGWSITQGQGTHQITANIGTNAATGGNEIQVTYTKNGCTTLPGKFTVIVNPVPAAVGTISGITEVCVATQNLQYSVVALSGANEYIWTLPVGMIQSGTGASGIINTPDNFINVDVLDSFNGGDIAVKGNNAQCNAGAESTLTVTKKAAAIVALAITQQNTCSTAANGSIEVTTDGVSYTLFKNGQEVSTHQDIAVNASPFTIANLGDGEYYLKVKQNGGCTTVSDTVTLKTDDLVWVRQLGSTGYEDVYASATDAAGNLYVTGVFNHAFTLGEGVHQVTLTNSGAIDLFVAKYSSAGQLQWAKKAGGNLDDYGNNIDVDAAGNVYVTGFFKGIATFDHIVVSTPTPHNVLNSNMFVAKYDTQGNLQWVSRSSDANVAQGKGVKVDPSGNVFVSGWFYSTIDFNGAKQMTSVGESDPFLAKYDANGNFLWAQSGGSDMLDHAYNMEVDQAGNAYLLGNFADTSTFSGQSIESKGLQDFFVAKYTPAGTLAWIKSGGGSGNESGLNRAIVDAAGNVYMTGHFKQNISFDGQQLTTTSGVTNMFLVKYDAQGNLQWAQAGNPSFGVATYGMALAPQGGIYLSGWSQGQTYLGTNQQLLQSNGLVGFVAHYKADGTVTKIDKKITGPQVGTSSPFWVSNINLLSQDEIYLVGGLNTTATYGNTTVRNGKGGVDGFVAKFSNKGAATLTGITGTTSVCTGTTQNYLATGVSGVTTYNWELSAGLEEAGTGRTGTFTTNTPEVAVTFLAGNTSGTIKVSGTGSCGTTAVVTRTVAIGAAPTGTGTITGATADCANQTVAFNTTAIAGASQYIWTFTPDDNNIAPTIQTTNTPAYSFALSHSGQLTVRGSNACGEGTLSNALAVTVHPLPVVTSGSASVTTCLNAMGGELTFDLNFSGAATYTVLKNGIVYNSFSNKTATVGTLKLSSLPLGTYQVSLTTAQGCVATSSNTVTDGSPVITGIETSAVSCDASKMGLFANSKIRFDIRTGKVPTDFADYTYTLLDEQGNIIVPETVISNAGNVLAVDDVVLTVPSPVQGAEYALVLKAYENLDPVSTGCTTCRVNYCEARKNIKFATLGMTTSLLGDDPQYVCEASGTKTIQFQVGATTNDLSLTPAGGFKMELYNESGGLVASKTEPGLPTGYIWEVDNVGVGKYTAYFYGGLSNYNCQKLVEFEVEDLEVEITMNTTPESCIDANDSQARVVVVGAKKDVTYEWQQADGTVLKDDQGNVITAASIEDLAPGNYKVIVTVGGICPNEKTFTLDAYQPLVDSLVAEVAVQECAIVAHAELTAEGIAQYPSGAYKITWYELPIDEHFTPGNEQDSSRYTLIYENSVLAAVSSTEPDIKDTIPQDKLASEGWYYIEISGPDGCVIKGEYTHLEKPRIKRIYDISLRWKTPEVKPKEPELPRFDFDVVFRDAQEAMNTQTSKCIEDQQDRLAATFKANCAAPDDELSVTFEQKQHHYTLYYFDRAGQLTQTVPPAGVKPLTTVTRDQRPAHTMRTTYNYNSLGQMVNQHTPDGGTTNFVHDNKGRIRFAQNDKQKAESAYAYTRYDALGRVVESGRATQFNEGGQTLTFPTNAFEIGQVNLNDALAGNNAFPNTGLSEQVLSFYNVPGTFANDQHAGKNAFYFNEANTQTYLRNRISYTLAYNQGSTDPVRTYFSYDPHGNARWVVQETPGLDNGKTGSEKLNYRMHLAYDYDLISGKILKARFNDDASRVDRFLHRYSYDEDNRLTLVETSRDGYIWDKDAQYDFYIHGPLKRIELGEDKIQGLDYAYTIHGWIKGMNSPILDVNQDLGGDGKSGSAFAPDVWGMSLTFYDGDFVHSNGTSAFAHTGAYTLKPGANRNLYNGNIATWTSALRGVSQNQQIQRAFQYKYDRLNRIKTANMYEWNGTAWATAATNNAWHTNYSYDGNGNLLTLQRYDKTGSLLDDLTYSYKTKTINGIAQPINQLDKVTDAVTGNKIEKEVTGTNQYDYDDIGNLVHDHAEDIVIVWNIQGKVSEVRPATATSKKPHIRYWYDAGGNRLKKEVSYSPTIVAATDNRVGFVRSFTDAPAKVKMSYYTRDVDGNTLAIYDQAYDQTNSTWKTTQKELSLYGSERLGTIETNRLLSNVPGTTNAVARLVGEKRYELKDHLGNVRLVVTDQKRYVEDNGLFTEYANVRTFKNYYPFGMEQPGDEIDPMLTTATLPAAWAVATQQGWEGDPQQNADALKVSLSTAPTTALWETSKTHDSKVQGTYQIGFDLALETNSDNQLIVTVKDSVSGQVLKEQVFTTAGSHQVGYQAIGDKTQVVFKLTDPTPNVGSLLEATNIALHNTDFGDYRYGFNGKENDQEWGKLIQDYGFRLYNPAIGKFLSVDPLSPSYPELTPYQFASNTPVWAIDLDGLEAVPVQEVHEIGNSFMDTQIGMYDQSSFQRVMNDRGKFTLHAITSGPNKGNFVAKQLHGRNANGVMLHSFTHIVGADRVSDFVSGDFSTGGWRSRVYEAGIALGGRPDGNIYKSAVDNVKAQWTDPLILVTSVMGTLMVLKQPSVRRSGNRNGSSKNSSYFQKYKADLAKAEKGSLYTANGKINPEIIGNSEAIINGADLGNQSLRKLLVSDGSKLKDWNKMGFSHGSGKNRVQLHYYYNESTGKVYYYDYKTYLNNDYFKQAPKKIDFLDNEIRSAGKKK